jgi:hypothetical protein
LLTKAATKADERDKPLLKATRANNILTEHVSKSQQSYSTAARTESVDRQRDVLPAQTPLRTE